MKKSKSLLPEEAVLNRIYVVRGQKVMIDRDLAELYGVETKRLKEAVRRNMSRFPSDFMFPMNAKEFKNWRTQFASSNSETIPGLRYQPFCFTEQGVTMLACVLNSKRAVDMNIRIIRVFARLREAIMAHTDVLLKLGEMEKAVTKNSKDVANIFQVLRDLLETPSEPRKRIGYRRTNESEEA
jgi:phage regulator Rha-like protein